MAKQSLRSVKGDLRKTTQRSRLLLQCQAKLWKYCTSFTQHDWQAQRDRELILPNVVPKPRSNKWAAFRTCPAVVLLKIIEYIWWHLNGRPSGKRAVIHSTVVVFSDHSCTFIYYGNLTKGHQVYCTLGNLYLFTVLLRGPFIAPDKTAKMVLYYGEHSPYAHPTMFATRHHAAHPAAHHQAYNTLNAFAAYTTGNQNSANPYDFPQYSTNAPGLSTEQLQAQHQSAMASAYFYDYRTAPAVTSPVVALDDHWAAFGSNASCGGPMVSHSNQNSCSGNNQLVSPTYRTSPASHTSSTSTEPYSQSQALQNSCAHNMFIGSHHQTPQTMFAGLNTSINSSTGSSSGIGSSTTQDNINTPPRHGDHSGTLKSSSGNMQIKMENHDWTRKSGYHHEHQSAPTKHFFEKVGIF